MSEISENEIKSMTKEQNYMRGYEDGKSDVLNKIRAEIEPTRKKYLEMNDIDWLNGCDDILEIIDKYKTKRSE